MHTIGNWNDWTGVAPGETWNTETGDPVGNMGDQYKAFLEGLREGWGGAQNPRVSHYARRPLETRLRFRIHYRVEYVGTKAVNGVIEILDTNSLAQCREMGRELAEKILDPAHSPLEIGEWVEDKEEADHKAWLERTKNHPHWCPKSDHCDPECKCPEPTIKSAEKLSRGDGQLSETNYRRHLLFLLHRVQEVEGKDTEIRDRLARYFYLSSDVPLKDSRDELNKIRKGFPEDIENLLRRNRNLRALAHQTLESKDEIVELVTWILKEIHVHGEPSNVAAPWDDHARDYIEEFRRTKR